MISKDFSWFPEQASSYAAHVDYLYFFMVAISVLVSAGIAFFIIFFSIKYRRGSPADRTLDHNHAKDMLIEVTWIVIPFFIVMGMFAWSAWVFYELETPPEDAMEITVIGKQWMWKFQHPNGRREINELHVPLNRSVRLKMTSEDVIHDVYVPAFRMKHDVLPGQFTYEWFRATMPGEFYLFLRGILRRRSFADEGEGGGAGTGRIRGMAQIHGAGRPACRGRRKVVRRVELRPMPSGSGGRIQGSVPGWLVRQRSEARRRQDRHRGRSVYA